MISSARPCLNGINHAPSSATVGLNLSTNAIGSNLGTQVQSGSTTNHSIQVFPSSTPGSIQVQFVSTGPGSTQVQTGSTSLGSTQVAPGSLPQGTGHQASQHFNSPISNLGTQVTLSPGPSSVTANFGRIQHIQKSYHREMQT